jgi:uncharacterized protein YbjT (DUF2867 family)
MILVAGGTGRLGSLVVSRLAARGLDVRVFARNPVHGGSPEIEVVRGDVRDRASIDAAMKGVTVVVSAVQGFAGSGRVTPASVDRDGNANLIDAAAEVGADVVLMSVVGATADNPMELFRAKYAAEQHLRASTVRWTIVRATAFMELWAEIMQKAPVLGKGENPINFVSVDDVAAVVDRAVVDASLRGVTLEVGGPQDLTFNEFATHLQETRGGTGKTRHIPRAVLQAMAPISRKARAAVAMDTVDMTFDAAEARGRFADLPFTDARAVFAQRT